MKQIETTCKICGQRLLLDVPELEDGPQRETVETCTKHWTAQSVHSLCYDRLDYMESKKEYDKMLMQKNQEWNAICPPYFQEFDLKRHPRQSSHEKAMSFSNRSVMLVGNPNTGKTMTFWQWIKREFVAGKFVYATTHADFSSDVIKMIQRKNASAPRWIDMISKSDIFGLDDIGKGKMATLDGSSSQAEALLWQIIDSRYRNKRICIFTSNWKGEALRQAMNDDKGEPMLRRIREMCKGCAVQF